MKAALPLMLTVLVLATDAAAASTKMSAAQSSYLSGAHNVKLTLVLRYEMQCGYPGQAPLNVTVPGRIAAPAKRLGVLVNGKPARTFSVHGKTFTIAMPVRPQVMCDVIGPGNLIVEIQPRAGVVNPAKRARYQVTARKGTRRFAAAL